MCADLNKSLLASLQNSFLEIDAILSVLWMIPSKWTKLANTRLLSWQLTAEYSFLGKFLHTRTCRTFKRDYIYNNYIFLSFKELFLTNLMTSLRIKRLEINGIAFFPFYWNRLWFFVFIGADLTKLLLH